MKYKEIGECVKELDGLYDKLYKRYCGVRACNECILAEGDAKAKEIIEKLRKEYETA